MQVHDTACVIANGLCHRLTSLQIQMAFGSPRGVGLQQYKRYQEWSLAFKVSDFIATMLNYVLLLSYHTLHFLFLMYRP